MFRILKNPSLFYIIGNVLSKGSAIITLPLFTRYIEPAEYGVIAFCLMLPLLLLPGITLGQSISISHLYYRSASQVWKQSLCDMMCLNIILILILLGLITVVLSPLIPADFITDNIMKEYLIVVFAFTLIGAVPLPYLMRLQLDQKPLRFIAINLVLTVVNVMSNLVLLLKFELGGISLIYGYCVSQLILMLIFIRPVIQMLNRVLLHKVYDKSCAYSLIRSGIVLWPSTIIVYFLYNSIRIHFTGIGADIELGIYSAAFAVSTLVTLFINGIVSAWLPWSLNIGLEWDRYTKLANQKIFLYIALSIIFVMLTYCTFSLWYPFLIGPNYQIDAATLITLICGHVLFGFHQIFQIPLYIENKVHLINVVQGLALVVTILTIYIVQPISHMAAANIFCVMGLACFAFQIITNSLTGKNYLWIPTTRTKINTGT